MSGRVELTFWGVRGSIPSPGPDTAVYGGNTSCLEIRAGESRVVLDAGSGIRLLGKRMMADGPTGHATILLISHTHWDHIQGLPFFAPAFVPGNSLLVAGPETFSPRLEQIIADQTRHSYFPLRMERAGARFAFRELTPGWYDDLVPGAVVRTCATNHPVVDLAYRIEIAGLSIVYLMDHEGWSREYAENVRCSPAARVLEIEDKIYTDLRRNLAEFLRGADLMVADAAYTTAEYPARRGWGHSTHEQMWQLAVETGVRRLAFAHHEPNRTDTELAVIEKEFQERNAREKRFDGVFMAREGMTIVLGADNIRA